MLWGSGCRQGQKAFRADGACLGNGRSGEVMTVQCVTIQDTCRCVQTVGELAKGVQAGSFMGAGGELASMLRGIYKGYFQVKAPRSRGTSV